MGICRERLCHKPQLMQTPAAPRPLQAFLCTTEHLSKNIIPDSPFAQKHAILLLFCNSQYEPRCFWASIPRCPQKDTSAGQHSWKHQQLHTTSLMLAACCNKMRQTSARPVVATRRHSPADTTATDTHSWDCAANTTRCMHLLDGGCGLQHCDRPDVAPAAPHTSCKRPLP